MIHIDGSNGKTFCGLKMSELAELDPAGFTTRLASSIGGSQYQVQQWFDVMAKRSNCPGCLRAYFGSSPLVEDDRQRSVPGAQFDGEPTARARG